MSLSILHRPLFSVAVAAIVLAAAPAAAQAAPGITALTSSMVFATPISDKYTALGGASGFLGTATIAEQLAPDGVGKYQHFQGGSIYWSPSTGAHEVHGLIRNLWASLGWETSYLGYPMTDEIDTYDLAGRVSKFQGGELIWRAATNAVSQVKSTDLVVDLPTKISEPWRIIQANAASSGSHNGPWVYCYDLVWNNDQFNTNGRELASSATARVVWVKEDATGPVASNVIVQRLGEGRYASTLHLKQWSWTEFHNYQGISVVQQALPWSSRLVPNSGATMARTGDVGAGAGAYHIHYCVTTAPDLGTFAPFESVPFAFRNYDVSNDGISWTPVTTGIPKNGQWVRRNAAGGSATITPGVDVLNYGDVTVTVSLPPGSTPTIGAVVTSTVTSAWGEPLQSRHLYVTAANYNGPFVFTFPKVPNYKGLKATAAYIGEMTPSANNVAGASATFDVTANQVSATQLTMTAN